MAKNTGTEERLFSVLQQDSDTFRVQEFGLLPSSGRSYALGEVFTVKGQELTKLFTDHAYEGTGSTMKDFFNTCLMRTRLAENAPCPISADQSVRIMRKRTPR